MEELLSPYMEDMGAPAGMYAGFVAYLELLLRWNERTNLTAIRQPEEVIKRHFGEGLHAVKAVMDGVETVFDLGSGAGFPGVPMQLLRPELKVTLGESQGKKAAFLRELVRVLGLRTEVHGGRADELIGRREFDLVVLRAVDRPQEAFSTARRLTRGEVMVLTTDREFERLGVKARRTESMPGSAGSKIFVV